MKTINKKQKSFNYSWMSGIDARAHITSCGINGKSGWIQVEHKGEFFGGKVSKALVKQLLK